MLKIFQKIFNVMEKLLNFRKNIKMTARNCIIIVELKMIYI